jgi:predicted dehydrogenase
MKPGALVVGLGQIGMGYDLNLSAEHHVTTHARSFDQHPNMVLLGGIDPDPVRCQLFEATFKKPAFNDIAAAVAVDPEIVVAAVPTQHHQQCVDAILAALKPQIILCEKPLAYELTEARHMVDACSDANCRLFVNYMRRSDPGAKQIKSRLETGQMEQPYKGTVFYSKGLFNNASHFISLLQYWLGEVVDCRVFSNDRYWGNLDPEPDFEICFEACSVFVLALREEHYSHYSIELFCKNGRLKYESGGQNISWQGVTRDAAFDGYSVLSDEIEVIPNRLSHAQLNVANELHQVIQGRKGELCSALEALQTQEITHRIGEEIRNSEAGI